MTKNELKQLIREAIQENIREEASMSAGELDSILHHATELKQHGLVTDESNLEDWVKAKLTIASQNLISVFNYLSHEQGNTGGMEHHKEQPIKENSVNIDVEKIKDIEVDGVDKRDYPDFVDAYVVSAIYPIVDNPKGPNDWRELTDAELRWLNSKYPEIAQEKAHESLTDYADAEMDGRKDMDEAKKKKWIQKAVNPKHKGYCTPMTKPTCTPARKALARRFKKGI